jgi:hypothetical protein
MVYWLVTVFLNNSDWTTLCNCIILWDMNWIFFIVISISLVSFVNMAGWLRQPRYDILKIKMVT